MKGKEGPKALLQLLEQVNDENCHNVKLGKAHLLYTGLSEETVSKSPILVCLLTLFFAIMTLYNCHLQIDVNSLLEPENLPTHITSYLGTQFTSGDIDITVGHIVESLQGFLEDTRHTNPVKAAVYAELEVEHGRGEWEDEFHPAVVIADPQAVKVEGRKRWVCEAIPGREGLFYKKSNHDTAKKAERDKAAREHYIRAVDVKMWQKVDTVDKTGSAWVDPKNIRSAMSYHLEKRHPFFADPNEEGNFMGCPKIVGIVRFTITCQKENHTLFYNIVTGACSSDLYIAAKDTNDEVHIMAPSGERTIYPGHVKAVNVKIGRSNLRQPKHFKVVDLNHKWVPTEEKPPASEESNAEESDEESDESDESASLQKPAMMSAAETPRKRGKNNNVSDHFKLDYRHIQLSQNVLLIILCQNPTSTRASARKRNRSAKAPSSDEKKVSDHLR